MDELWIFWSKINVRQLFYYTKKNKNGPCGPCTVCVGHVFILLNYFWIMFPLNDKWFIDFLTLSSNWTINVRARPKMPSSDFFKQTHNEKVCLQNRLRRHSFGIQIWRQFDVNQKKNAKWNLKCFFVVHFIPFAVLICTCICQW